MHRIDVSFQSPLHIARQILRDVMSDHFPLKFRKWTALFLFYTVFGITGLHRLLSESLFPALLSIGCFLGGIYLILFTAYSAIGLLLLAVALFFYLVDLFQLLGNNFNSRFRDLWIPMTFLPRFVFFVIWLCWVEFIVTYYSAIPFLQQFVDGHLLRLMEKWIPFM